MRARFAALIFALALTACPRSKGEAGFTEPPPDGTVVLCPVSGERCEKTPLTQAAVFESKTYYFCCAECPKKFRESPETYVLRK